MRTALKWTVAAVALAAAGYAASPEDESNYSVQFGMFNYLPSFYASFNPTFGIIAGKAAMIRMARSATTRVSISFGISVSFGISNQQSSLDGVDFTLKLHSKPCALNGGPVYQHPFLCPDGCTQAEVDAAAGTAEPLEVSFTTQMNTASANEASITYDWPVYVPEFYNGESRYEMSVILYDPVNNVPMVCADLEEDRQMDGLVYSVNEQLVDHVPAVSFVTMKRSETGNTELAMRVANLQSTTQYTAEVHSLPCVSSGGGPIYMRDYSCVGRINSTGCEPEVASNVIRLPLAVNSVTGVSDVARTYPGIVRADGQSIHLKDCLNTDGTQDSTGVCAGGRRGLMCIDLLNEIPQIASSSTTAEQNRATTEEAETTTPQPLTDAPTTAAPTSAAPTSDSPTSAAPTEAPSDGSGDGGDVTPDGKGDIGVPNNCPNLEFRYDTATAKGKSEREVSQLDGLSGNNCCLASFPPQGLTAFYWQRQHVARASALNIVAGVAGAVLAVAAVALMAFRRSRTSEYSTLDPANEDGYSVPR